MITRLQRAHLLCLSLNASENSCTCTRVCFCSSCEFSALESTRPRRYQQMYIDSTTYGEGHFDKYGSQKPRVARAREKEYYYTTTMVSTTKWWFLKHNQNDFVVKEFHIISMRTLIALSFVRDIFTNGQTYPTTRSLAGRRRSRCS